MNTPNSPRRDAHTGTRHPSGAAPLPGFGRPAQTPATETRRTTAADVLEAPPLALARLLCGPGLMRDLRHAGNDTRAHLAEAYRAMGDATKADAGRSPAELDAARQALRAALDCAIRPDGIDHRAETILAQAALWLVEMQAEVEEVGAMFAAAAAAASHGQPRH